ncbi:MAG: hypothetical protein KF773_03780 [Deltaproteobacteria bacterium]|nr:hypothetical protein [Deltaproteobacteria bacterium]MCW5807354.1 hypothetical protein [Deltaproteobacteria bacterium]
MRIAILTALAAAACTSPQIDPGAYFCGPDGACPEGQACNGPDNVCVAASTAKPFECGMGFVDVVGDDTAATGQPVTGLGCVSIQFTTLGCLQAGDIGDWFQFDVPDNCAAVKVDARVSFPVAFERLELQLSKANGPPATMESPCSAPSTADSPEEVRCLSAVLEPGAHYAIGVVPDGTQNCDARCANNRYTFSFQLKAP